MLIKQLESLYLEMTTRLHSIEIELNTDLNHLSLSLEIIESAMARVNSIVDNLGFANDEEEIQFFKIIKPKFYSNKIFLVEQFNILSNIPIDTDEQVMDYYLREINFLKRFFEQNPLLYQYYINSQTALDAQYFLRKNLTQIVPAIYIKDLKTNADYIFAKFRAYEKLREFLLKRVKLLRRNSELAILRSISKQSSHTWTDDKIKLVELAYGIYFMGSINDGKVDISQIIDMLETTLNIDLGVAYRKFVDISRRKSKSYTVYLDDMRNAIHQHINSKLK